MEFNGILRFASTLAKSHVFDYVDVELPADKTSWITKDQSQASMFRIHGIASVIGDEEFNSARQGLESALASAFGLEGGSHSVQLVFERDPSKTGRMLNEALAPARKTAKTLGLDVEDIIGENAKIHEKYTVYESVFLTVWTHPTAVNKETRKKEQQEVKNAVQANSGKDKPVFIYSDTVDPFIVSENLAIAHRSFIKHVHRELKRGGLVVSLLPVETAMGEMRRQMDPGRTSERWRPWMPGDKEIRMAESGTLPPKDVSDLAWPRLDWQIGRTPHQIVDNDNEVRRVGNFYVAPMHFERYPVDMKQFGSLLNSVDRSIPWRISYHLQAGTGFGINVKRMINLFFAWAHSKNRMIRQEIDWFDNYQQQNQGNVCRLRISAVTWHKNLDVLRDNLDTVVRSLQSWGRADISTDSADTTEGIVAASAGAMSTSPANAGFPPLEDVSYLAPLTRPASYWTSGAVLFYTPDNKLWAYQPGSSQQDMWIDLFWAKPGKGKSVLSNSINLALCLRGGLSRLPRIAIIDIGPSSSGFIRLLKDSLPEGRKHEALNVRMQMRPEHAINPFDLQHGARLPNAGEKAFQLNLLSILATPAGREKPHENMVEMLRMVVDEIYKTLADPIHAKPYEPGRDSIVDEAIEKGGHQFDQYTRWYEVVDTLMHDGRVRESARAQRYAVPTLPDLASFVNEHQAIRDLYGPGSGNTTPTGEPLTETFSRMMSDRINAFPILAEVTQLDLSDARVIAMDLMDVAPEGSEYADLQSAVMYMLARFVCAKDYYLKEDDVRHFPKMYQAYQEKRIREIRNDTKRIVFDEFHRTAKVPAVRAQVKRDMREGRKWGILVGLISQMIKDFDGEMQKLATNLFILGGGDLDDLAHLKETVGLTKSEEQLFRSGYLHGPQEGGSSFLLKYEVKDGWKSQWLRSVKGALELWSYTTNQRDDSIMSAVQKALGTARLARRACAHAYPGGSAASEVDKRINDGIDEGAGIISEAAAEIEDEIAGEIVEEFRKLQRAQPEMTA